MSALGAFGAALVAACSAGEGGEEIWSLEQGVVAQILLNEIKVDPPGNATAHQYIELRGTPSGDLSGYFVVVLEDDGDAAVVVNLQTACGASPCTFGTNGLLLIRKANGHTAAAPTTSIIDDSLVFGPTNATRSVLVVLSPTTAITEGTNYTPGGTLTLPADASVIDAVGWDAGPGAVYGGVSVPVLDPGQGPDALTRLAGNDTAKSVAAWFYGELEGNGAATAYDPDNVSANTPEGASLTPGVVNFDPSAVGAGGAGGGDGLGGAAGAGGATGGGAGQASGGAGEGGSPDVGGASGSAGDGPTPAGAPGEGGTAGATGEAGGGAGGDAGSAGEAGSATGGMTTGGTVSTAGRAGAQSTAGRANTAGSTGTAGSTSTAGRAGAAGGGDDSDEDDGCGCRTPGSGSPNSGALAALGAALAIALRRRRRQK